jgi:hypothetical protein
MYRFPEVQKNRRYRGKGPFMDGLYTLFSAHMPERRVAAPAYTD